MRRSAVPPRTVPPKRARRSSRDSRGPAGRARPSMNMVDTSFVFMCKQCNVILAEGRSAFIYNEQLDVIACLQATTAARVDKEHNYLSEEMQHCVYNSLKCKICSAKVGLFLISAVAEFAHLRQMFCFSRTSIVCYSIQTKQMFEGSQINVNVPQCLTELKNLEKELLDTYNGIMQLGNQLLTKVD